MTSTTAAPRALARALTAAVAGLLALAPSALATEPEAANFDARPDAAATPAPPGAEAARDRLRERLGRFGTLTVDDRTGTLRSVGRLDGFLTGPSGRDAAAVALGYVRDNAAAFGVRPRDLDGLRLVSRSSTGGIEHLAWEQRVGGIPVADAGLRAAVTGAGRLMGVTGPPVRGAALRTTRPAIGAAAAYAAARRSGGAAAPVAVTGRAAGPDQQTRFADGGRASLALYRSGNALRLGWRVLAPVSSTGVYDVLVDAAGGEPVKRVNRVRFAQVFRGSPLDDEEQQTVDFSDWLAPGATTLSGPAAHAFSDVDDVVGFRPDTRTWNLTPGPDSEVHPLTETNEPLQTDGVGENCTAEAPCTWDPEAGGSWATNHDQSVTQLFYFVNAFLDHLRDDPDILWTDGEFRTIPDRPQGDPDFAANPANGDPILAQALDGANTGTPTGQAGLPDADHRNNASFLALPDGLPGLLQAYLWAPTDFLSNGAEFPTPFGAYDGANDPGLVFHEVAHGLSERLVTDAAGFGALSTPQAGAIGEGTSDFYAMDYLVDQGIEPDDPDAADVRLGRYLDDGDADGVRFQPIDQVDGGYTYADFGDVLGIPEVHADGEIWAQTLWSLRAALIESYGGNVQIGTERARRYVTAGLRAAPPEPSFLEMRNAILQTSVEDGDEAALWSAFAERGMGYFAFADGSDDVTPIPDFTDPATLTQQGAIAGKAVDEDGVAVAGATVGVAGFDTGLGPDHTDTTGLDGTFEIEAVPTTGTSVYPAVRAQKPGFDVARDDDVPVPATGVLLTLVRDWSSSFSGGAVATKTGPDNSSLGCGPGGLIDDDPGSVWGTSRRAGGQAIVVELDKPIDVASVAIDPGAGCGDDPTASLGQYELLGAPTADGPWTPLHAGTFGPQDIGRLNDAFTGNAPGLRYVRLIAQTPQGTAPGTSGEQFMDVAELRVRKVPGSPTGAVAVTGGAPVVGFAGATVTGSVTAFDAAVDVVIEYGTTTQYGQTATVRDVDAGTTPTSVTGTLAGLAPSTLYHFRVVAVRDGRRYPGADATFTTKAAPPPRPAPTPTPTPAPTPDPDDDVDPPALATAITSSQLTADRRGMFKLRWTFGDVAPAGKARVRVLDAKRRTQLAKALVAVRPGRKITKTLRLNAKGRALVDPGSTRRVRLELRLPGGGTLTKTAKLKRAR